MESAALSQEHQARSLAASDAAVAATGGDPLEHPPLTPEAQRASIGAWLGERLAQHAIRNRVKDEVDTQFDLQGLKKFRDDLIERYKKHNQGIVAEDPVIRAYQSRPIQVDPNEIANWKQMVAKWHNARVAAGIKEGVYNDPKLKNLLQVLGADAELGVPSYYYSGEQKYDPGYGPVGFAATEIVNPIVSQIWNAGTGLLYGIGGLAYRGITGKEPTAFATHALVDDNGNVVTNAGKLPTFNETAVAIKRAIFGGEVDSEIQNIGLAEHYADLRRSGLPEVVHGVSDTIGMFAGMTAGAGPAMAISGNLARFGIVSLIGADKLAHFSPWAKKIIDYSVKGAEAAGNGVATGLMFGHHDGFANAFIDGTAMTVPLMVLGALGKKAETAMQLLSRGKMPAFAQRTISGALQGAGFAGVEIARSPELWEYLRNPNDETWARWTALVRNQAIAMAIFHGITGTTPGQRAMDELRGLGPEVERARVEEQQFEAGEATKAAEQRAGLVPLPPRDLPPEQRGKPVATIKPPDETGLTKVSEAEQPRVERYTVEGRPGRPLPVIEHEGYVPGGVAGALERGEPSKHIGEREIGHEEARRKADEKRRAGQRGRDPLEDPAFPELPQELRERLIAAADVGERRRIWQEAAPRVLADRLDTLRAEVERVGVNQEQRQKWMDLLAQANMTPAERAMPRWAKVSEALRPERLAQMAKQLRALKETRESAFGEALLEGDQPKIQQLRGEHRAQLAGEAKSEQRLSDLEKTYEETKMNVEQKLQSEQPEAFEQPIHHRTQFPHNAPHARLTAEGVPGTQPIHAIDVIREGMIGPVQPATQAKGMNAAMRRRARGYYSTREDLIRMRESRDLNNHAHEWGHAFFEKYRRQMQLSPMARAELWDVGEPTSSPRMTQLQRDHEGMAEFIARHLWGDPELRQRWPNLSREVFAFIGAPEQRSVAKQLDRMEKAYRRWYEQGMLNQVRMSIMDVSEPMSKQEAQIDLDRPIEKMTPLVRLQVAWKRGLQEFRQAMIDDIAKMSDAQQQAFKKAGIDPLTVPIDANPVRMLNALRGKGPAVLETFLFRRAIGFGGVVERGGSLRDALSEIKAEERAEFMDYLNARRSLEAQAKGLETQLSRQHYLLAVERYGNPRFERAAQATKKWFDHLIDYAVDAGSLTEAQGHRIKSSWMIYIPFFRAIVGPKQVRPGRGVAERGSGVEFMRHGDTTEIRDPLETALEVGMSIIQKAHQAAVMKSFNTLHLTTNKMGRYVTEVPRSVAAKSFAVNDVLNALGKIGREPEIADLMRTLTREIKDFLSSLEPEDAESLVTLFFQASKPKGADPIIAFVPRYTAEEISRYADHPPTKRGFSNLADQMLAENGKLKWLRVDPDAYEAVMSIDPATQLSHPILRAITLPTRAVKWGATVFNPDFVMRNISRDTLMYSLFTDTATKKKFIPVVGAAMNFVDGLVDMRKPEAKIFRDIGGHQPTYFQREFSLTPRSHEVQNPSGPAEAYRKVINALATPEVILRTREALRVRERALEKGKTELEANLEMIEAGQEVTINYIRAGTIGRVLNHWIPYFNPSIQGARKFSRTLFGFEGEAKQKQAVAQGLLHITSASLLMWLLHRNEDWYQDLPPWRRNNYWTFRVPFTDELITVPKPFEAGKVFGNVPEFMLDHIQGEPVPLSEVGWDLVINFIGGVDFLPALFTPIAENLTNYSFFRRRKLIPHWIEESRMPQDQYTAYTTGVARWLGKQLNISPIKIENAISGYSGGFGLKAMRYLDQVIGPPPEQRRGLSISDIPGIGTFFAQEQHKQGTFVQQIYDLQRELTQKAGSGMLTPAEAGMVNAIRNAEELIGNIQDTAHRGAMSQAEANQRSYEVARPVIEAYRQATAR